MKALSVQNQEFSATADTPLAVNALESLKFAWLATMANKAVTTRKTYSKILKIFFDWLKESGVREVDDKVLTNFFSTLKAANKSNATMKIYYVVVQKFFSQICNRSHITDFTKIVERPNKNETENLHKRGALDEMKARKVIVGVKTDKNFINELSTAAAKIVAYECGLESTDGIKFNAGDYQRKSNRTYLKVWNGRKFDNVRLTPIANQAVHEFYLKRFEILRNALMVELMLKVGLRTVEVTRMTTKSVGTRNGRPVIWIVGKGRTQAEPVIITPALKRSLENFLEYRADFPNKDNGGALFCSISKRNFGGTLDTSTVAKAAKTALEIVNTDEEKYSAHSLRHTAACIALKGTNYNLEFVRQMLRHRNVSTTSIYINDIEFWQNDATKQIELALE